MIINLNKFQSVKNITMDFTKNKPGIYFLLDVDEKTPRYKKIKNTYVQDLKGNYVMDHSIDILGKVPRVLKYIGESTYPVRRIATHYFNNVDGNTPTAGVGPVFTHVRVMGNFKRFEYDSIRLHQERLLVRKYLPDLNNASQLTDSQKLIILNSGGKVTPYDLIKPYLLHARDLYRAFKAWEIEDIKYINHELAPYKLENKSGLIHPNKRDPRLYRDKKNIKKRFSRWIDQAIIPFHKKQVVVMKQFYTNYYNIIKFHDPERHEKTLVRIRACGAKNYKKNKKYILKAGKIYRRLKKKIDQPVLL